MKTRTLILASTLLLGTAAMAQNTNSSMNGNMDDQQSVTVNDDDAMMKDDMMSDDQPMPSQQGNMPAQQGTMPSQQTQPGTTPPPHAMPQTQHTRANQSQPNSDMPTNSMPRTAETQNYDGPDSFTATQPPPNSDYLSVLSQSRTSFRAQPRTDYPTCSRTVRDNCRQARDPGY